MTATKEESSASSTLLAGISESFGQEIDDHDGTLWELFTASAASTPDNDAFVSMWQAESSNWRITPISMDLDSTAPPVPYLRWSYRHLYMRSSVLADWLSSKGIQPQDRVAVFLWNSAEWPLFFWACAKLGAVFCPLDPRAISTDAAALLADIAPAVLVVQDETGAAALEPTRPDAPVGPAIRIQCSESALPSWTPLHSVLVPPSQGGSLSTIAVSSSPISPSSTALIVFTSGTTATPKGCPHTHSGLLAQTHQYDPNTDLSHIDRWLVHTPSSHVFAVNNATRAWRLADAVIFPSPAFNLQATVQALVKEQCTIMSAVPTLIKALMALPDFPDPAALRLRLISISGTVITPEDIRLCKEGLGAKDAIQAYGMSEGAPVLSWSRRDEMLNNNGGYHSGVGKVLPGARVRICRPGSREIVPRGEAGELHIGGPPVIRGYWRGVQTESFYSDQVGNWLTTGDQAWMDSDGVVYLTGRYKDVIIRGGENVSPVKLETAMEEIPGVVAQVIGVADDLAGQVPVAVVRMPQGVEKQDVAAKCLALGPMFALDGVYTLEELGMETFPMTALGKVKKEVLRKAVSSLRAPPEPASLTPRNPNPANDQNGASLATVSPLIDQIAAIWEDLVGEKPAPNDSISAFADSITLLRFCDRVLTLLGQRIYLADFLDHDTVAKQAVLVEQRSGQPFAAQGTIDATAFEPLNLSDVSVSAARLGLPSNALHLSSSKISTSPRTDTGSPRRPAAVLSLPAQERALVPCAVLAASSAGFSPSAVEEILRIKGSFHLFALGDRPQSYHTRIVFRVHNTPPSQIRRGIETALTCRPIFRTIIARLPDATPFHVVITAHAKLFDSIISTRTIPDRETLDDISHEGSDASHRSAFTARFQILSAPSIGETFIVATYSHSIFDALSLLAWHLDLGRYIRDPDTAIPPLTPFRLYADLYNQNQESLSAQTAVEWNVERLRGISRFSKALWPVLRAQGCMIASQDQDGSDRAAAREKTWESEGGWDHNRLVYAFPRYSRVVALQGVRNALSKLGISPSLLMKTAIAIFNILQTRSSYAVFNTWHAARKWPFIPSWMESALPPAMGIDGPTTEWIVELIEVVRPGEDLAGLLRRLQEENELLEGNIQAPWQKVLAALRDEADTVLDASARQAFVWDVSMGMTQGFRTGEKTLEVVTRYDWPDCALFWNAFMLDSTNMFFIASWDSTHMSVGEVEIHCETMASVLRKLIEVSNWGRMVSDVFDV